MKYRDYKSDFPALNLKMNGKDLVYLDSAATTQKPTVVLESIENYYKTTNANPHRGAYYLSMAATEAYESARDKVREFINAYESKEVIFTKNATEALNLVAYSYGMTFINEGDEIVISIMEHHSNLIPWQQVAKAKGAVLKYIYCNEEGIISLDEVREKITDKTKIVAITHVSNVLGTINPVKEIAEIAHLKGSIVVVDSAQGVPHIKVDVQDINADFLVFSGHKLLAPMGIGVLYGKKELLEKMPPFMFGGDMVEYVYEQETTFNELPYKFEGGTQNVGAAIGLATAIEYLDYIGMGEVCAIEKEITEYTLNELSKLSYVTVYGPKDIKNRGGVISFTIKGVHSHDIASIFDSLGVAVRSGNHCAQPLMAYLGINSTARASFYFYNTKSDADNLIGAIKKTYEMFLKWRE